jgi:hypothetical protein
MKNTVIVFTRSEREAEEFHQLIEKEFKSKKMRGSILDYSKEWVWVYNQDDNDLSGSSGPGSFTNTVTFNEGAQIFSFKGYKKFLKQNK